MWKAFYQQENNGGRATHLIVISGVALELLLFSDCTPHQYADFKDKPTSSLHSWLATCYGVMLR